MTSQQQQDMLNACASGDVTALQHLFKANNITKGTEPVYIAAPDGPPPVNHLLKAAINNGNRDIVSFLLETYDRVTFYGGVIDSLLEHPDLGILEILYNYDNHIVQFEWDDYINTFVTKACRQPPEKIAPLLHFLIEHDACLDTGGSWTFAVHAALCGNQNLDVIEAMLMKGGPVTMLAAQQAVIMERADAIEIFMRFGVVFESDEVQDFHAQAEETGDVDVIKWVHLWTSTWEKNTGRENQGPTVAQRVKRLFKNSVEAL
ncbi:hypothetical protein CC80DRAFT_494906, partial [Byssothecium circinans]